MNFQRGNRCENIFIAGRVVKILAPVVSNVASRCPLGAHSGETASHQIRSSPSIGTFLTVKMDCSVLNNMADRVIPKEIRNELKKCFCGHAQLSLQLIILQLKTIKLESF